MTNQESIQQQIQEYQEQLRDVEQLLQITPDDAALQVLKTDLLELLSITQQALIQVPSSLLVPTTTNIATSTTSSSGSKNVFQKALEAAVETTVGLEMNDDSRKRQATEDNPNSFANVMTEASIAASSVNSTIGGEFLTGTGASSILDKKTESGSSEPMKKKSKNIKEFEIPSHLRPNDGDTEAERNKKRRAIKALKNKWNEKKKEYESEKKQQSWQTFQKKKTNIYKDRNSIFSTAEIGDSKVGVVAAATSSATGSGTTGTTTGRRQMTEFTERKRYK